MTLAGSIILFLEACLIVGMLYAFFGWSGGKPSRSIVWSSDDVVVLSESTTSVTYFQGEDGI